MDKKYILVLISILLILTFSCNKKIQNKELTLIEKRIKISEWFIWGLMLYGQKTRETDRHPLNCIGSSIEQVSPTKFEYINFFRQLIYEVRVDTINSDYLISDIDRNRVHIYIFSPRLINKNGDTCFTENFPMHVFYFKGNDSLPFWYYGGRNLYIEYDANLYKKDEKNKLDLEKMNTDFFFKYWGNREREDSFNLYLLGLDENIKAKYAYAAKSRGYIW